MHIFFENQSAKVYYDTALDALFLEYTNKVTCHDQFVVINTAVLNAFTKLQTQKFIADVRKMGVIGIESQKWVVDYLLPGMIKHLASKDLIHVQFMDEVEIFSKIAANKIKDKSSQAIKGIQISQFSNRAKMETYLKSF
ncbi:hypothetical protein ACFQ21_22890 [Ohtaekwangia kribbensis]|jgi:hypothetical protein|uniref:Uncharacterized protein n=1 Tax=Ohtaekwangia kribbensis TaxID=688913 RepID=A0ABW3K911_9BACT